MADTPDESALTAKLHGTTDAMVWATEFCRLFGGATIVEDAAANPTYDGTLVDVGTMVGWFANAIEIGRSAGQAGTR